ncbi:hypothetical protein Vretifemale_930 [Volvox reticuliferus]|uniref:Uncharacterized protein n=1 Tax=Volvox reticuliferus TaxID=1737510 RepID=A0A8J4FGM9_9CHLO|nr:hypothetical protein Vretifemale_930 [Volvox reticuliferus]
MTHESPLLPASASIRLLLPFLHSGGGGGNDGSAAPAGKLPKALKGYDTGNPSPSGAHKPFPGGVSDDPTDFTVTLRPANPHQCRVLNVRLTPSVPSALSTPPPLP